MLLSRPTELLLSATVLTVTLSIPNFLNLFSQQTTQGYRTFTLMTTIQLTMYCSVHKTGETSV